MSSILRVKEAKQSIIQQHSQACNFRALAQVALTFTALALLWWAAAMSARVSACLTVVIVLLISLFTLRVFALMHDCGHGSLFRSRRLNRVFGFLLGVVAGMPQYVWSKHHNYHHAHNGNWEKYRGPYTTLSVDEYAALPPIQQRTYRLKCSIVGAPLAGFIYLIFNPRFTWLKGSIAFVGHVLRHKLQQPAVAMAAHAGSFRTRYWKSPKEYRHMCWNNIVLLSVWAVMCYALGGSLFFKIYLVSLSLAGGAGIVLFTVQHNFRHAYASDNAHWDYDTGAITGTSFLVLPAWLNWFTVDIGYHHIHHLSASIPNYRLSDCHDEYQHLFGDVTRVKLSQVYDAFQYILWDNHAHRIISVAEYQQQG